jgi:hypothetical protein
MKRKEWAIYHNPPFGKALATLYYDTRKEAEEALERLERIWKLRFAYVDRA